MAKKSSNANKSTRTWSVTKILDCLAYFSIMFIAIALILSLIFKNSTPSVAHAFRSIGECLAYVIAIWLGFYWTRRKSNVWWFITWLVATVLIVVVYIFNVI